MVPLRKGLRGRGRGGVGAEEVGEDAAAHGDGPQAAEDGAGVARREDGHQRRRCRVVADADAGRARGDGRLLPGAPRRRVLRRALAAGRRVEEREGKEQRRKGG